MTEVKVEVKVEVQDKEGKQETRKPAIRPDGGLDTGESQQEYFGLDK